jgi:hypothetical protein
VPTIQRSVYNQSYRNEIHPPYCLPSSIPLPIFQDLLLVLDGLNLTSPPLQVELEVELGVLGIYKKGSLLIAVDFAVGVNIEWRSALAFRTALSPDLSTHSSILCVWALTVFEACFARSLRLTD